MIEYIKGTIDELTPTQAIVEAGGVGYQLFISLNTYSFLQGRKEGKLFVHEAIRQDQGTALYGFASKQERDIFLLLIGVSGIGGQTARMILSAFTPAELATCISNEDARTLKSVKGIGPKAAGRIIVELKDKMIQGLWGDGTPSATSTPLGTNKELIDEAVAALSALGFPPAPTHKTVMSIVQSTPDATVETIIKQALKML